jgi:hypothetical protein
MSMDYIRRSYGVPAKRGARVTWWACMTDRQVQGTIVGARGHYLRIRLDDEARTRTLHPTWRLGYHETPNVRAKGLARQGQSRLSE